MGESPEKGLCDSLSPLVLCKSIGENLRDSWSVVIIIFISWSCAITISSIIIISAFRVSSYDSESSGASRTRSVAADGEGSRGLGVRGALIVSYSSPSILLVSRSVLLVFGLPVTVFLRGLLDHHLAKPVANSGKYIHDSFLN